MAKSGPDSERERVKVWQNRIKSANKLYDQWTQRFQTRRLEDYWEARQWFGYPEDQAAKSYVVNLVYAAIETQKPALLFAKPQYGVRPRPARQDDLAGDVQARADLVRDAIQTVVDDQRTQFELETNLAVHEAFFRFGCCEVGYSADWIDNPNAGKPELSGDGSELEDEDGKPVLQASKMLKPGTRESVYVRRIPATQVRCSISGKNSPSTNDWIGYYEWVYLDDVKQNPRYKNTSKLTATGAVASTLQEDAESGETEDERKKRNGMVKLWKIWDLRTHKKHVLADNHPRFLIEGDDAPFLPLAFLKFHERLDQFYPMPPVFQWLGAQDSVNEGREAKRIHRKRYYRRYETGKSDIDDTELDKLETGGDGVIVKNNLPPGQSAIRPIQDAPLGQDFDKDLGLSYEDFTRVSGVSGEQQSVAQSKTATQSNIIDQRARLRETRARVIVGEWLEQIGRLILFTLRAHMALPWMIQMGVDPSNPQADQEAQKVGATWKEITAEDLGTMDFDLTVDLASLSPVSEDAERAMWTQVLALLANPMMALLLGQSMDLLTKTLRLYGIRNQREIAAIQQVLQKVAQMMQQQAGPPGVTATAGPPGMAGAPGGNPIASIMAAMGAGKVQ